MISFPPFDEEKSRYERKFAVSDMEYFAVQKQIALNPAAFSPLYFPRYINNIYLDTHELDFFYDNVSGKADRIKARIRWYHNQLGDIEKPVLEFKIRKGFLGNKISFPLVPMKLDESFDNTYLKMVFESSDLPLWAREVLETLKPSLLNRYMRKYFISFDEKFRMTLDSELSYCRIGSLNNSFYDMHDSEDIIVELKYSRNNDDIAAYVTNSIPFRLTKSSKYVNGVEMLNPLMG